MAKRRESSPKSAVSDKSKNYAAASEELDVLERLSQGVLAQISDLTKRPQLHGNMDPTEFALLKHNYAKLKAYEELAHHCYGRTSIGTEVDHKNRPISNFTYRIAQTNVGFLDKNCFVLARNSPLASALVSAQPGDETEITTPRDRYLNIDEVRVCDGPVSLRSPSEKPNFRSMAIRRFGTKRPAVLEDLRAFVRGLDSPDPHEAKRPDEKIDSGSTQTAVASNLDPTWLNNWTGVYLGESDESSLGHQFFTRTTQDQERALNNPRGLTFVEGIAGAGKTSVALGRLKFFANFATGAEREHYGLQHASENDFSPVGMVGFVLSHSLKRYLKETASALGLEHLPIRDFEEFRTDLASRFGITGRFKKKKGETSLLRSRVNWLRAVDAGMARSAGIRLRENLTKAVNAPKAVIDSISKIVNELTPAEPQPKSKIFHLSGLAARIVGAVADGELRAREAVANERFRPRAVEQTEQYRREQIAFEREMRRIQQESEKKIVSPLAHSLLSGLTSHGLISSAVALDVFPTLVRQSFGDPTESSIIQDLDNAVADLRGMVQGVDGHGVLTDTDIVSLVILAGMIADGFDHFDQRGDLRYLYQMRRHSAVFIDEVQDFTEIEIVLMGMTATSAYHQITLSGDRSQRLQSAGAEIYDDLFPWVPRSQQNTSIFLDYNFRQREELAALSSGFRFFIQNNRSVAFQTEDESSRAAIYKYGARERMADFILQQLRSVPQHASIAVITPTVDDAQTWFDFLEEDLAAYHRPALMSRRDDLTRRLNIHFTEVRETKGLEFDVVIVPDIGSFALNTVVGRNQTYVAISRPKHSLILGCSNEFVIHSAIKALEQNNLICIRDIPSH
jgi:hypothetical protein